jgi:A/G-specific adenine glycosylase
MRPHVPASAAAQELSPALFARLVAWQRTHGRSHLPWQHTRDPYRVWLSEIMLQQTQVVTVLGYYERFLARCPTVADLAAASADEVMALWSGLGYYSRARNLHTCAQQVVARFGGVFPSTSAELQTLPGIGPSTAAAIAAFCFGERISIMDGNVKRVLSRALGFDGDLAQAANERALSALAQALVPPDASHDDMIAYTQGLMDLGASLCARTQPQCLLCPLSGDCRALAGGTPDAYPVKTRKLVRRHESWWLLALRRSDGAVWLERRPPRGIWAGLYCTPVFGDEAALVAALAGWGLGAAAVQWQPARKHSLTHRELRLLPAVLNVANPQDNCRGEGRWATPAEWAGLGLPAPVRAWLDESL